MSRADEQRTKLLTKDEADRGEYREAARVAESVIKTVGASTPDTD
jgi:hypothetical protein